jgi:transcriptional regulator with XRE-family HTH domain
MKQFSIKLQELLNEKDQTQKKICEDLNLSKNQIHYWIKDKAEPNLETLTILAHYFEKSTDYLLGLENEDGTKIYETDTDSVTNSFNGDNNTYKGNFGIIKK